MKNTLLAACVLTLGIAATGFTADGKKGPDGAELLEKRCSVCHQSSRPKAAKKTHEQWEATVTRMMGKGAKLDDAEKKALIDYLTMNYKP